MTSSVDPIGCSGFSRRAFFRFAAGASALASLPILTEAHLALAQRPQFADPNKGIHIDANENPLGPSEAARQAIANIIPRGGRYLFDIQEDLAATFAGIEGLNPESVMPFPGSSQPLHFAVLAFTGKNKPLVIADPGYEAPIWAAKVSGTPVIKVPLADPKGAATHDIRAMLAASSTPGVLYICNPNNPTGILTEKEDLLRILAQTEREKVWFILDEAFIDFIPEESLIDEVRAASRLVILRSLTKFFALPGLRAGYLVSNPEVIQYFSRDKEPWRVNALAQMAAVESLQDKIYVARTKEWIRLERKSLTQGLRGIPGFIPYPSTANYLFVQLHPTLNLTAAELRERLILHGILIRDCNSFHHLGPYFFRIAVRSKRENQALLKALRQVHREIIKGK